MCSGGSFTVVAGRFVAGRWKWVDRSTAGMWATAGMLAVNPWLAVGTIAWVTVGAMAGVDSCTGNATVCRVFGAS